MITFAFHTWDDLVCKIRPDANFAKLEAKYGAVAGLWQVGEIYKILKIFEISLQFGAE